MDPEVFEISLQYDRPALSQTVKNVMKIGFLIHGLNSGGAERQLVLLAKEFKKQGHEVAMCVYSPGRFFEPELQRAGIPLIELSPSCRWQKFIQVYRWLREWKPQVLQAFLPRPNALAELTTLLPHSWKVVVSERDAGKTNLTTKFLRQLHRRANWITTNSYAGMDQLLGDIPSVKNKTSVIWNMVDLEHFVPAITKRGPTDVGVFQFLFPANFRIQKNGSKLLEALCLLRSRGINNFHVRWVGKHRPEDIEQAQVHQEMLSLAKSYQLEAHIAFVGEKKNMFCEYNSVDALVLVSWFEGVPNVVCEAMACQVPVVLSNVGDNAKIVGESGAGFLCVPQDTQSIADAMERMITLSEGERTTMRQAARSFAEKYFNSRRFLENYIQVYEKALNL